MNEISLYKSFSLANLPLPSCASISRRQFEIVYPVSIFSSFSDVLVIINGSLVFWLNGFTSTEISFFSLATRERYAGIVILWFWRVASFLGITLKTIYSRSHFSVAFISKPAFIFFLISIVSSSFHAFPSSFAIQIIYAPLRFLPTKTAVIFFAYVFPF